MKYLLGLFLVLSLQGCMYQSVNETELAMANQFCESKQSKVVKINSYWMVELLLFVTIKNEDILIYEIPTCLH